MSTARNKEIVQRVYDALAQGDRGPFSRALHEDCTWRLAGHSSWSRAFRGREAVQRDLLEPLFRLFATQFFARAINLFGDGAHVIAEVRGDAETLRGEHYNNEYCFVFRFRRAKIAEVTEYCDTDLVERVLGRYENALAARS